MWLDRCAEDLMGNFWKCERELCKIDEDEVECKESLREIVTASNVWRS